MFTRAEGLDFFVNLRASMLDDHRWFAPFVETFTAEKLPWVLTGAPHSYAGQPAMEEYQALIEDYRARGARP